MLAEQRPVMRALRRIHTSSPSRSSNSSSQLSSSPLSWIHLRSLLVVVVSSHSSSSSSSPVSSSDRGTIKSPWFRRRRKHLLRPKQWKSLFTADGRLGDGGVQLLRKARKGGIDPSIRAEVWPFLLGVYDVNSSKVERDSVRAKRRREYENLRKRCRQTLKQGSRSFKFRGTVENSSNTDNSGFSQVLDTLYENMGSIPIEEANLTGSDSDCQEGGQILQSSDSSESDDDEPEILQPLLTAEFMQENVFDMCEREMYSPSIYTDENFQSWQRIIRLDAIRANDDWTMYSTSQSTVSESKARQLAESVGLKDYEHLEPCRIYHAARLVAILEAYAVYDPEIGYCQGMSDLLSPIISIVEENHEAFWCFVAFMRKSRHNFRLDEVGIRRQLSIVSKIIKCKDSHLYRHLQKLQAEDCFFVYRMVVVLFRRELSFEQTLCLWEVMWADQAAIRAGIAKSGWGKIRIRAAPPTDDLLLYAIAACVLQRRKLIIEKYNSIDEIMRECNGMAGNLDVWKLLDDAHDLVVTLHDKI